MATTELGRPRAQLVLPGSASAEADIQVLFQSKATRITRSLMVLGLAVAIMPVAFFIPPHFLWPLLSLAIGLYLARRYWTGEYYVIDFDGSCPRCATALELGRGTRIRRRQSLECYGCHRHPELILEAPVGPDADGSDAPGE